MGAPRKCTLQCCLQTAAYLAPVSPEEQKHYTSLIDGILATADLETVTRKSIRGALETALGGKDLSDQKVGSLCIGWCKDAFTA